MEIWRPWVKQIAAHVEPLLLGAGYTKKRMSGSVLAHRKESEELVQSVVFTKLPPGREPDYLASFFAELVVQSKKLHEVFGWDPANWTLGPIRMDLSRVEVFPVFDPNIESLWRMNTEGEAEVAATECARLLTTAGLGFLSQFQTDADIVVALREGGQHVHRGRSKAVYDADVLDGLIDPKVTPYSPEPQARF